MNSLPRSYDSAHTSNIDDLDDLEESRVDDINNLGGMVIFILFSETDVFLERSISVVSKRGSWLANGQQSRLIGPHFPAQ